jgi:hypothetical protein
VLRLAGAACTTEFTDAEGTVDPPDSYQCACLPGFEGHNCRTDSDECASRPCERFAPCTPGTDAFTCTCHSGFTGDRLGLGRIVALCCS